MRQKLQKVARYLAAGLHVHPKRRTFRNRAIAAVVAASVVAAAVVIADAYNEDEKAPAVGVLSLINI